VVHGFERVERNRLSLPRIARGPSERPRSTRQPVGRHASCIRAAVFKESPQRDLLLKIAKRAYDDRTANEAPRENRRGS
jgi:hypothetical protein